MPGRPWYSGPTGVLFVLVGAGMENRLDNS